MILFLMKKGQLAGLDNTIVIIGIVGITLAAVIFAITQFNSSLNSSAGQNVLGSIVTTLGTIPTYITMIVTLALIGVVMFIVKRYGK